MSYSRPARTKFSIGAPALGLAISAAIGAALGPAAAGAAQSTTTNPNQKPLPPPRPVTNQVNPPAPPQARTPPQPNNLLNQISQANAAAAAQRNTAAAAATQRNATATTAPTMPRNATATTAPTMPRNATATTAPTMLRNATATTAPTMLRNATATTAPTMLRNATTAPAMQRTASATTRSLSQNSAAQKAMSGPPVASRNFPGHPAPPGSTERQASNGSIVRTAADGSVIDVHNPRTGVSIHHAVDGSRRITVEQADHSRVFIPARGVQYVQHPYMYKGHPMVNRTLVVQGRTVHQIYRPYTYGNTTLDVYATSRYFAPNMYQWAGSRLQAPEKSVWTYTTSPTPWYGHYRGYFTPDAAYQTPLAWLTDYMLAATLFVSYSTRNEAADPPPADAAPITPEVKQKLADEVGRQVKTEAIEAQQSDRNVDPPAGAGSVVQTLSDRQAHVFVASSDLDLVDPSGRRCSISDGDVVEVTSGPSGDSTTVNAVVLSSKGGVECGRAAQVQLALEDVQEMQNHMRETIDQGLANTKLAKQVQSKTPEFAAAAPPPDANAASEIKQQEEIAAAAEG